jgi:succinate dehydrogenase/fumarate reductase iron-sulfur protein
MTNTSALLPEGEGTVRVRVLRSAATAEGKAEYQEYRVATFPRMSVLDALFTIQREQDRTLSFRCSCRLGMCGTCAMIVDGREGLACQTLVERLNSSTITLRPLNYLPVVKDLVVNMDPFFDRYRSVKPFFVPKESTATSPETLVIKQAEGQRKWVDPALGCISCGICFSSCSVVGLNESFPGPAALNRAYTLVDDERDAARDERLAIAGSDDGVWRCHQMFNCASACPRHITPTQSIRQLRQEYIAAEGNPLTAPVRWIARKLSAK